MRPILGLTYLSNLSYAFHISHLKQNWPKIEKDWNRRNLAIYQAKSISHVKSMYLIHSHGWRTNTFNTSLSY